MFKKVILAVSVLATIGCFWPKQGAAEDIIMVRRMSMELAVEVAAAAVQSCRDAGYQASAVVVDRMGIVQAVMRDIGI